MDKTKVIKEETDTIIYPSDSLKFIKNNDKNKDVTIAFEDDNEFKIVKNFSSEVSQDAKETIVKGNNPTDNSSTIYYAEEVYEEDDLFDEDEYIVKNIDKGKSKSFKDIAGFIDEACKNNGYDFNNGTKLLAALNYSHFIYASSIDYLDDRIEILAKSIEAKIFKSDAQLDGNIALSSDVIDAFSYAKDNEDKLVFIYVSNINKLNVINYIRPIASFIDNPQGKFYISFADKSEFIPKNIYIIFKMEDNASLYELPRKILRYVVTLDLDGEQTEIQPLMTYPYSLSENAKVLRESEENFALSEDSWKRIDTFSNDIGEISNYHLSNKTLRKLEEYSIVLLSCDIDEDTCSDYMFSYCILNEALICDNPSDYLNKFDINQSLDNYFGFDKVPLTRKTIKFYLSSVDREGDSEDE